MNFPVPGIGKAHPDFIVAIVGPSASGKSAVAIELALLLNGEILSVDSMQVYRGMNIGTAKPSAADQARVRHHLLDLATVASGFDAAAFRAAALPVIEDVRARGKRPILCGGTGFYFAALLRGLGSAPAGSPSLRGELEHTSLEILLEELRRVDPDAFASVDRRNRRRVVRAVEVNRLTGRPFSHQRAVRHLPASPHAAENENQWRTFGLLRTTADLRARIEARVEAMFKEGLVEETRELLSSSHAPHRTPLQAIGYRQTVDYLRGERSLEETLELVKSKTRQLARRQMTWFRRQMRVTWLSVDRAETAAQIAKRVQQMLEPP